MAGAFEEIRPIEAEETHALRQRILRPTQSLSDCAYPLDHAEGTLHVGCFADGALVGVASVFREPAEDRPDLPGWRVRGMAALEGARGRGIGGRLLLALVGHAARFQDRGLLWCNGRTSVQGFYERHGFRQVGPVFDLPPLGPHVVLHRPLGPADRIHALPA